MENAVSDKYGRTKKVKYLVTSLDDLKDIVDTVRHMILKACEENDVPTVEEFIILDAIPLKNNLSSFILDLRVPEKVVLANSSGRSIHKIGVKR